MKGMMAALIVAAVLTAGSVSAQMAQGGSQGNMKSGTAKSDTLMMKGGKHQKMSSKKSGKGMSNTMMMKSEKGSSKTMMMKSKKGSSNTMMMKSMKSSHKDTTMMH